MSKARYRGQRGAGYEQLYKVDRNYADFFCISVQKFIQCIVPYAGKYNNAYGLLLSCLVGGMADVTMQRNGNGKPCIVEKGKVYSIEGFWSQNNTVLIFPTHVQHQPYKADLPLHAFLKGLSTYYKFNKVKVAKYANLRIICERSKKDIEDSENDA